MMMVVPFVIYADFESFIKPIDTARPRDDKSYTLKYEKHIPSSYSFHIKCFDENIYSHQPIAAAAASSSDAGRV